MERTSPPRGPSRPGTSGFRSTVQPTRVERARAWLTPRRLVFAAGAVVVAAVGSFFLDTAFPEAIEARGDIESRGAGRALLERMAEAAGGVERATGLGAVRADVEDRWVGPFAALTPWDSTEARFELLTRVVGPGYHTRMTFVDGLTWGYDGEPWIDGGDATPTPMRRARLYTRELPRLLLAPFAALIEGATAELIAPGTVSVRFRDPGRAQLTLEWRLYIDPATARLTGLVLPFSGADPSPLSICTVRGWHTLEGVSLPTGYDCVMANRARLALHTLTFENFSAAPPRPKQFAASWRSGTLTATVGAE